MRGIVRASIQLRFIVLVLAAALVLLGVSRLQATPVDVMPEFDPPLVEVQTEALGLSAEEVESLITVPMEADLLNGVAWLDRISSESVAGMSSILLVFEPGTDPIKARQMVQERLTQAHALPNVSTPPVMLQPLSATSRVMMVGISSEQLSMIDLGVLARWTIKPRLMGIPGVANVAIWGQRERQMQVQVDPQRLAEHGVSLQQVIESTGEALWVSPLSYLESSSPGTAGWIDTPNQRLNIRHTLPIRTAEDLAKVTIVGAAGLTLGDVASVVVDHQPLIGDARVQDNPGLLLVIQKFPGASTLEVTRGVEEALAAMQPGLGGVEIDSTIFRPASYVEAGLGNLSTALLAGGALLLIALAAFFFNWRAILVGALAIFLALTAAVTVLSLAGASLNMLVLAGLAVALCVVIDDVVVDVERITRRLREQAAEGAEDAPAAAILAASLETRRPLLFATLIILLAVLPVFFLEGLTGPFFQPFAVSYVLALLTSLAVALVATPALSALLFPRAAQARRESPLVAWMRRGYSQLLGRTVKATAPVLLLALALLIGGGALLPLLSLRAPLPAFRQTDLLIEWEGAPGTSVAAMNRIISQVSQELEAVAGVRAVSAHVGRAITGDAVVGVNSGELWLNLDAGADYAGSLAAVRDVIDGYPGLFRSVQTYEPERIGEALQPDNQHLVVRVYGTEIATLREKAEEVRQRLAAIGGVSEARADLLAQEPEVQIEVDLAAAERYQVKPGDVRRAATTLLSGLYVGNLFEDQKVFDVVVWSQPQLRDSLTDIDELLIDTPNGQVRLGELAEVRIAPALTVIQRDAVSRYVDVIATVEGRSLAAVAEEAGQAIAAVSFPLEYHAELQGEPLARQDAMWRMLAFVVAALIGMFLLMQAVFDSWRLAVLAFLATPVALAGGALAAVLTDGSALAVLFGLLALLAIAVRNSVALIDHFQQLRKQTGMEFGEELVLRGAIERFAPTVIALLATALALAPFLALGPIAGLELVHPIAVVILGGLVTTLLLDLFILPTLYLRFGAKQEQAWSPRLAVAGGAGD